jgi:membrane protease YdiL (CAAX protease family)
MLRLLAYLLAITVAEVIVLVLEPVTGLLTASAIGIGCHVAILFAAIIDAAIINKFFYERLVLSLAIVPLIRIVSLSLPLADIPQIWQYPIIYLPLLATAVVLAHILGYKPREMGISFGFIPLQLAVGLLGVGIGLAEHFILLSEPLITELSWQAAWLPALVLLLATGFVEEFIFRGVLQQTATEALGGWGIVYVSYIFTVLHVGWLRADSPLAPLDLVLVFIIALFFGWVVKRTGSLLGVTLAHGITNIVLFLVAPFFF